MVNSTTYISDSTVFLRDNLIGAITDPISSTRNSNSKFVLTSYPARLAQYPLITIRSEGTEEIAKSGMRSELSWVRLPFEIRIWARNEREKDILTQQVINQLRTNQYDGGSSSSDDQGLHDFSLVSAVPVDEPGEQGIKSMVLTVNYKFFLGA